MIQFTFRTFQLFDKLLHGLSQFNNYSAERKGEIEIVFFSRTVVVLPEWNPFSGISGAGGHGHVPDMLLLVLACYARPFLGGCDATTGRPLMFAGVNRGTNEGHPSHESPRCKVEVAGPRGG